MTTEETLQAAIRYQQAGEHAKAEELYRQILASDPLNCDALHLLGAMAHQAG